jgi:hypothetical protein
MDYIITIQGNPAQHCRSWCVTAAAIAESNSATAELPTTVERTPQYGEYHSAEEPTTCNPPIITFNQPPAPAAVTKSLH